MKFSLNESQAQIRELANKILQEQVTEERLRELDARDVGERFDRDVWQQLATAGLLGIAVDEAYGGMGFDFFSLSLLLEEVGRSVAAVPVACSLAGAALVIQQFGSDAQKQRLLPAAAQGESVLTVALSEAMSGSNIDPVTTSAVADGDGFKLDGVKHYVPYAAHADAIVVSASVGGNENILVLVEPGQPGVKLESIITTNGEPQSILALSGVAIAADNVIATGAQADAAIQYAVNCMVTACCVIQTGASDAAMRMTAAYTGERKQFNQPIAAFQAVAQRAADCYIDVECLRLCAQQAASLLSEDAGSVEDQRAINDAVSIAKVWAGDTGHRVSYSAQHLHGGTGVDREYPLWRYCMLLRQMEFSLGCAQQHLNDLGDRIAEYSVAMA